MDADVSAVKFSTEPVEPMHVAVIGGTGDGGSPLTNTIAKTPDGQPNLAITVITPLVAILVRFVNLFLTTLVGLLMAAMTPMGSNVLHTGDFMQLLWTCASLSLPGAAVGLIKDTITIFSRIEQRWPLATGTI